MRVKSTSHGEVPVWLELKNETVYGLFCRALLVYFFARSTETRKEGFNPNEAIPNGKGSGS